MTCIKDRPGLDRNQRARAESRYALAAEFAREVDKRLEVPRDEELEYARRLAEALGIRGYGERGMRVYDLSCETPVWTQWQTNHRRTAGTLPPVQAGRGVC